MPRLRWPGIGFRIPLILLLAGGLFLVIDYELGVRSRQAHLITVSRAHAIGASEQGRFEIESGDYRTKADLDTLFAHTMYDSPRTLIVALVDSSNRAVVVQPDSFLGRDVSTWLDPGPTEPPQTPEAHSKTRAWLRPDRHIVSVGPLLHGPFAGHRYLWAQDISKRLAVARREKAAETLPSAVVGAVLIALVALLLDRWLRAPASRLAATAHRLAAGERSARAGLKGTSELARVGQALDHMAERHERAQRDVERARHTLESVLEALPAAVVVTDRESSKVLFVNSRFKDFTMIPPAVGENISVHLDKQPMLHTDGSPYDRREFATPTVLRTGKPAVAPDFLIEHPPGRFNHLVAFASPISLEGDSDFDAVVAFVQDRSEVAELLGELRTWEQRFEKVVEATGQVVYEWELPSGTVRRSGSQQKVLGFTWGPVGDADPLAQWRTRLHPEDRDRTVREIEDCVRTGRPFEAEYRFRKDSGEWIVIHDRGFFELTPDGRPRALYGTMSDVTALREVEAQLRQAQKMETVGTLAGGIAHDFNNQLTGVIGHLDLLTGSLAEDDERREHARVARLAARRCAELTRGLLAFSRRLHSQPQRESLNRLVGESVLLLRRVLPATVNVRTELAAELPDTDIDATQIQQVIFNLCINARDAMPEGGDLVLSTRAVEVAAGERRSSDAHAGRFVLLTVADSGAGIPADVLPRIFEPFFTTKPVGEGTGLGLAMAYGIVSKHRGWMEVESEPGHGARFLVFLPETAWVEPNREPVLHESAPGTASGELVLIVDDEEVLLHLAGRALRDAGFEVITAANADAAVAAAAEHRGRLRAVVMDMMMPGRTGAQAVPDLLAIDPTLRVLLTSGYSREIAGSAAEAAGFLPKPYSPSQLVAAVRTALGERKG